MTGGSLSRGYKHGRWSKFWSGTSVTGVFSETVQGYEEKYFLKGTRMAGGVISGVVQAWQVEYFLDWYRPGNESTFWAFQVWQME